MTSPTADLAASWDRSSDGKTIVFTLRDDVLFHSGRQFSGDDVVWNWNRIINDIADRGPRTERAERGDLLRGDR